MRFPSGEWPVTSSFVRMLCLLLSAVCLVGCSIPNLEAPECTASRDEVREFYSLHFGNDMTFSPEHLEARKAYLTPQFYDQLKDAQTIGDPFTQTEDLPKAFRVSECRVVEPGKHTSLKVLLFWKTDTRSEQRPIQVESVNINGKWLVDSVANSDER